MLPFSHHKIVLFVCFVLLWPRPRTHRRAIIITNLSVQCVCVCVCMRDACVCVCVRVEATHAAQHCLFARVCVCGVCVFGATIPCVGCMWWWRWWWWWCVCVRERERGGVMQEPHYFDQILCGCEWEESWNYEYVFRCRVCRIRCWMGQWCLGRRLMTWVWLCLLHPERAKCVQWRKLISKWMRNLISCRECMSVVRRERLKDKNSLFSRINFVWILLLLRWSTRRVQSVCVCVCVWGGVTLGRGVASRRKDGLWRRQNLPIRLGSSRWWWAIWSLSGHLCL